MLVLDQLIEDNVDKIVLDYQENLSVELTELLIPMLVMLKMLEFKQQKEDVLIFVDVIKDGNQFVQLMEELNKTNVLQDVMDQVSLTELSVTDLSNKCLTKHSFFCYGF